jgi:hypothetical protein
MPFSKYDVDPARVEMMRTAFYRVCESLTERVALTVYNLAKEGETDLDRLCSRALMELDARSRSEW